ncbi:hypothetical protein PMAYCL1PPCAC_16287, partial [Pristionchus mayeri]
LVAPGDSAGDVSEGVCSLLVGEVDIEQVADHLHLQYYRGEMLGIEGHLEFVLVVVHLDDTVIVLEGPVPLLRLPVVLDLDITHG